MRYFVFILAFVFSINVSGQTSAQEAILQLKEGTLIVKLIEQQKKIDMLLKAGKKEEAIAFEEEQKRQNENLIQAFSTNYTFSRVLFIYSYNMGKLADGDPSVLFTSEGKGVADVPPIYLFIELSESPEQGVDGFVVRDRNNDHLNKPFPYFVSQYDLFHLSRLSFPKMIKKWEKKLNSYYSKVKAN